LPGISSAALGSGGAPAIKVGTAPTVAVKLRACVGCDVAPYTIEDSGTAVGLVAWRENETEGKDKVEIFDDVVAPETSAVAFAVAVAAADAVDVELIERLLVAEDEAATT